MDAKFVGDPRNPGEEKNLPEVTEAHGLVFERGKWVKVPEHLEAKFEGNSHFDTRGGTPAAKADDDK